SRGSSSPVRLSAPVSLTRDRASSPPCFPCAALCTWRLPSLDWILASRVLQRHRYHEGATTSHRRLPRAYGFALGPRVLSRSSFPYGADTSARAWSVGSRGPFGAAHDDDGISQVPGQSILYLCPVLRPRSSLPRLA